MTRIEIIANQSVQDVIIESMETEISDFLYTIIPLAYGRGGGDKKLGTSTWPETNFMLIAYIEDEKVAAVRDIMERYKQRYKNEGIKMFAVKSSE